MFDLYSILSLITHDTDSYLHYRPQGELGPVNGAKL